MTVNIGIIKNFNELETINILKVIKDKNNYWLPIQGGNDDFKRLFAYLKKVGITNGVKCISKDGINYTLYNLIESIPLFPYTYKQNNGDGLVHYKMIVDKIVHSPQKKLKIDNTQLDYDSMYSEADIWLRITQYSKLGIRGYKLEDEFKPFIQEYKMKTRKKFYINFKFDKDYLKLSNFMIVQNYNHHNENCCCLMCR